MRLRYRNAVLCLIVLCLPHLFSGEQDKTPPAKDAKEVMVYITKTGEKYHAAGCRYLKKSSIPTPLSEAKKKYTACSVCNPPE